MKNRKYIRLKDYDYSNIGYYYITICINNRQNILGEINNSIVELNILGKIIEEEWLKLEGTYKNIKLDKYIIMPNHIHGIIVIKEKKKISIMNIIGGYKSITSRKCNKKIGIKNNKIWQRSYYERIIRNEKELYKIRKYIIENPLKNKYDI